MSAERDVSAMTAEVEVELPHPVHAVWELITDIPRMALLSPEVVHAAWLSADAGVEGSRYTARNQHGPLRWEVNGEVVTARPMVEFSWVVGDAAHPSSTWTYELRPVAEGTRCVSTSSTAAQPAWCGSWSSGRRG